MREVVITGFGLLLPNCDSRARFWTQVSSGESQLRFEDDPSRPGAKLPMGRINDFEPSRYLHELPERFYLQYDREIQLYLASVLLARDDARLALKGVNPERVGLFDGTARPTFAAWYERIRAEMAAPEAHRYSRRDLMLGVPGQAVGICASLFGIRGPTYTFTGTCAAGAIAFGHAFRELQLGEVDVAFATGHDTCLVNPLFAMYRDAGLLSLETQEAARAVRPYVGHSTNAFGEGAVTLVLETRQHAEARGAHIFASVLGYRHGNNGYHPTTVDVAGVRPAEIIRELVGRAEVSLEDIGFVVGHGNAVQLSDVSEENYMRLVFGARANQVPLISTKPIYGHTLGCSSAINIVAAALMLERGFIAPTINIDERNTKRATNHQPNRGAAHDSRFGLSMSYGLGGHNTAILLKRNGSGSGK